VGSEQGARMQLMGSMLGGQSHGAEESIRHPAGAGASILSCHIMGYASRFLWCDALFVNKIYSTYLFVQSISSFLTSLLVQLELFWLNC